MTFETDLVSIITPAFNSARFIRETIESVLKQTYPKWEHLIAVDAGTTDNTIEIIQEYSRKDPRIQLVHLPNERGVSTSRNRAIERSRGQYIALLDSDDYWLPTKLEEQLKFMKSKGHAITCHSYRRISEDGATVGELIRALPEVTYSDILKNNTIACLTGIYDRTKTGEVFFIEGRHEDYILWLDLLKRGFSCYGLDQDLARYRYVATARSRMIYSAILVRWNIYRKREKIPVLNSFYYLVNYIFFALNKRRQF